MNRVLFATLIAVAVSSSAVATADGRPGSPAAASKAGKHPALKTGFYKGKTAQGFALNFVIARATSSRCEVPDPPKHPQGRFCFLPTGNPKIDEPCSNGIVFHNYVLALFTYVLTPGGTLQKTSHSYSPPDPKPVGASTVFLKVRSNGTASGYLKQTSQLFIPADPEHPAGCDSGKVKFSASHT